MATATDQRTSSATGDHAMVALGGLILIGTAIWFASSWIDTGSDSTCGAVIHPGMWLGDNTPNNCAPIMTTRALISGAAAAAGACLLYATATTKQRLLDHSRTVLSTATAFAIVLVIINEAVRSGGGL